MTSTIHNSYHPKIKPIAVLYASYVAFFISVFFRSNESALTDYLSTITGLMFMIIFISVKKTKISHKQWEYCIFILVVMFSLSLFFVQNSLYTILLYFKITIFIWFFSAFQINRQNFIDFVNLTYFAYLTASFLVWAGIVPNHLYEYLDNEYFHVHLSFIDYRIMYGIEGSPANIDSYSGLVFLMNLFIDRGSKRNFYLAASLFGILSCFRMTPIIAIFSSIALYPFYKNGRLISSVILIIVMLFFITILFFLYQNTTLYVFGEYVEMRSLAYVATHARSMIWIQQLESFISHSTWVDYIFGRYSITELSVPTFQLDERATGTYEINSHNNYLLLFFRSPFMFLVFFLLFIIAQYKHFSKETFPIVLFLFLAAFSNSSLVSLGNPIYLCFLTYFMCEKKYLFLNLLNKDLQHNVNNNTQIIEV